MIKFLLLAIALISAAHASEQPSDTVESFFNGLIHERFENRFGLNKGNQFNLMSEQLRQLATAVECNEAHAPIPKGPALKPPPYSSADAETVFDRWDTPTACSITGSKVGRDHGLVDVKCSWDGTTDHPAGESMQLHVVLERERNRWVISNVHHGEQTDGANTANDLLGRLRIGANYQPIPRACRRYHSQ